MFSRQCAAPRGRKGVEQGTCAGRCDAQLRGASLRALPPIRTRARSRPAGTVYDPQCTQFRRNSSANLPQMRPQPGYIVALLQLASPAETDPQVKLMSAIVLKNAAWHSWEHVPERNLNLPEADKDQVRQHVMAVRPSALAAVHRTRRRMWALTRACLRAASPAGVPEPAKRRPALGPRQSGCQHRTAGLPGASRAQRPRGPAPLTRALSLLVRRRNGRPWSVRRWKTCATLPTRTACTTCAACRTKGGVSWSRR